MFEVEYLKDKNGQPKIVVILIELWKQLRSKAVLSQTPLIAEVAPPTDPATDLPEELFGKAQEYLQSGSEEVWLVFPESHCVLVWLQNQLLGITGEIANTQKVLPGSSMAIAESRSSTIAEVFA